MSISSLHIIKYIGLKLPKTIRYENCLTKNEHFKYNKYLIEAVWIETVTCVRKYSF